MARKDRIGEARRVEERSGRERERRGEGEGSSQELSE